MSALRRAVGIGLMVAALPLIVGSVLVAADGEVVLGALNGCTGVAVVAVGWLQYRMGR